ncbi:hypothetical protein P692DRAFT_20823848, partial [Suillus brevipes Sb2]
MFWFLTSENLPVVLAAVIADDRGHFADFNVHNRDTLELGRTTDPGYSQLSGTDTVSAGAELSESSNFPPHSTATSTTSSDSRRDMTETRHHNDLTECHSHWQESESSTYAPDEAAVDRFPALPPHLNRAPGSSMHSPGTTFVIVNGMTVVPDEVDAMVDESEDWDWQFVSRAVVAAAAAAAESSSRLEHDHDGDAAAAAPDSDS